jgi:spore photoproduct lyase
MTTYTLPMFTDKGGGIEAAVQSPFPIARRNQFIKQFTGPDEKSGVVCFKFWQLVHASGCPFSCAYCFLQTTTFFRFNKAALMGLVYANWQDMVEEVKEWLAAPTPRMLIVGELQDGLAFDSAYAAVTGKPLTHHLVPLFAAQKRHRLVFLTKSTLFKHALMLEPTPQVVFSWSVNTEYIGKRWEQGAPLPSSRFAAATKMQDAGWPIRFRLDPMIPYHDSSENWRDGYAETIDQINLIGPEMVTIGALRASSMGLVTAAEQNGRPIDLFQYLSEKDPSGFKYRLPFEDQVALYRFAIERLDHRRIIPALCKEDVSVWKAVGLEFNGCHCLLEGADVPHEIVSTDSYLQIGKEKRTPMSKVNNKQHFEDYRAQTQVKHEILAAYLPAYFRIVGKTNKDLLYIDGFAGLGTYTKTDTGEVFDGSPLLTLKLIAGNNTFSKKVTTLFIEVDSHLYDELEKAVTNFAKAHPHIRKPTTVCCTFAHGVQDHLKNVSGILPPTFLFVDPCGVSGTSFDTIKSVMACRSSEAFIFFNIDGVRRIAGLSKLSDVLVELLGSRKLAEELLAALQNTPDAGKRERMILESYRQALREDMGVKYTIPFRVESEEQRKTSHYLIHASNHPLGFKIMKEVMWNRGHSETGQGDLQLVQASRTDYFPLFDAHYDTKKEILKALADGPQCVDLFYSVWVIRPDDLLCQPAYKQALLELEASGEIEVLDKDKRTPKPVQTRKRYNDKPTLGKGYYVRLMKKAKQPD